MFSDPAGDALADRQSNRSGELVELGGGRAHEHHLGRVTIDDVNETGVRPGCRDHEAGHLAQ